MVVAYQLGRKLVRLAIEESVEAVEPFLQRPVGKRPGSRTFRHRGQVPLARRIRGVAVFAKNFGQRRSRARDRPPHIGKPGVKVGDGAHAHRMVVAPRHEAGARG